ncbi:hypothetical protein M9Y10_008309 [Tritrichomonas musculus]|uniref:Ankyrin repeat protein n=1 Tax=Tritrichomonas musculus TaxID=1915356 RepID=A0ABR2IZK1_9EUKA
MTQVINYIEPTNNITEFLKVTLINDKVKHMKEFIQSSTEVDFKFEPTTTDLPEEIQYQCPMISAAIYYNAVKCFDFIAESGAKLTATDSWHTGIIHQACRCGRVNILSNPHCEELDFGVPDWRGRHPIHYAAEFDQLECLKFLVETKNVNINAQDKFGMTPLHVACEKGNVDILNYLLDHNAEILTDCLGRNPVEVATAKSHIEVLQAISSKNSSLLTTKNPQNRNLAHYAALSEFDEGIKFLSAIPEIDFNQIDSFGMAPIHYAAEHDAITSISQILSINGINKYIDQQPDGNDPLHVAAFYGSEEAFSLLINPDDKDATNKIKQTALHIAAENGHIKSIQELMNLGLDPNAIDNNGRSPREAAHGCYMNNIMDSLNGKKQMLGDLCEPEPYPKTRQEIQQEQADASARQQQEQNTGCIIS